MRSLAFTLLLAHMLAPALASARSLRGLQEGCSFPLQFHVNETQADLKMALGITVRSSTGDSMEYITGDLDFKANETTNVTFPMLPCGASIYGILVRLATADEQQQQIQQTQAQAQQQQQDRDNAVPAQVLIDYVEGTYNGRYKRSAEPSEGYMLYWGELFIPFGRVPSSHH